MDGSQPGGMFPPHGHSENPMRQRKASPAEHQMFEDLRWAEQAPEVRQHLGKLVVVHRKRVIAVGTDQPSLVRQAAAQESCPEEDLVVIAVSRPDLQETPH